MKDQAAARDPFRASREISPCSPRGGRGGGRLVSVHMESAGDAIHAPEVRNVT